MSDSADQQLRDLPPSAKLVLWVLEDEGPLTQKQIAEKTLLSSRTVRYAVGRLTEINAIDEQTNIDDGRQTLYTTTQILPSPETS